MAVLPYPCMPLFLPVSNFISPAHFEDSAPVPSYLHQSSAFIKSPLFLNGPWGQHPVKPWVITVACASVASQWDREAFSVPARCHEHCWCSLQTATPCLLSTLSLQVTGLHLLNKILPQCNLLSFLLWERPLEIGTILKRLGVGMQR